METFIHKYLSRHYKVSTTEESSKKIQLLVTYGIYKKVDDQDLVYGEDLIKELSGVFDLKDSEATKFINDWSITQDRWIDLTWYWSHKAIWLPEITRVVARTIQQDLIGVEPMKSPTGKLLYLDYQYSGGTIRVNEEYIEEIKAILLEDKEEQFRQSWVGISSRKKK